MEKIDFAAVKSGIPIDCVLGHYGVETRKRNNTYLVANCPLPSHTSKDSPFSFAINTEKNLWTCHSDSCKKVSGIKGGDVIDLVCLMEGVRLPLDGAKMLVQWFPGVNGGGAIERTTPSSAASSPECNKPLAFTLQGVNPEHPMIQGRGISIETAKLFGVGFFPGKGSMAGRIVFPLLEKERIVGYAGRLVEPKEGESKWKMPPGLHFTFLYGLERCDPSKMLILCESFWGVLYFHERGAQCAALMGKELTEAQEQLLVPFHTICLALDNDAPGREATQKIANRLRPRHKVFKAFLMEG